MGMRAETYGLIGAVVFVLLGTVFTELRAGEQSYTSFPLAGVTLSNRARLTYTDKATGYPVTLDSNAVRIVVQALEALTLTRDQCVSAPPGAPVCLSHRLINRGNAPATVRAAAANASSGDHYDLTGLLVVHDLNDNGRADPGEPILGPDSVFTLGVGASTAILVQGAVPAGVPIGQRADLVLTVTTLAGGVYTNHDCVTTTQAAVLSVMKSAVPGETQPGGEITFTLNAANIGNTMAAAQPVTVDGAPGAYVLLRDALPPNTSLVRCLDPPYGTLLYHRRADPLHRYSTTPPAPADVDAVAYGVPTLGSAQALQLRFIVRVHDNANVPVSNTGYFYHAGPDGTPRVTASNEVVVSVRSAPATIRYYEDNTFSRVLDSTTIGSLLYIQVDNAACNLDPNEAEVITVHVTSTLTGDTEVLQARESGPNSGYFRVTPPVPTRGGTAIPGNGAIETMTDDVLLATVPGCGAVAPARLLIDPFGIVFHSRTNVPVAGVTVTLVDVTGAGNGGIAGGPAVVFQDDGVTPAPSTVVTSSNGAFRFPRVLPSTYRLAVQPPNGYRFPSLVPAELLDPGRTIHLGFDRTGGSYGDAFEVSLGTGDVNLDVPVDADPPAGLFIEKTASCSTIELGEFVRYTVRIRNRTGFALVNPVLTDLLPLGFAYRSGSTRLDGVRVPDPQGGAGPRLGFALPDMAIDQECVLSYRVRIGPGTRLGENRNVASALGTTGFGVSTSNLASATVLVRGGAFTDKGFVVGKVFVDRNGSGSQDPGEPGIPGVRLYMEDGTFVITDQEGMYSLYGLSAATHVLKVDRTTLPPGSVLAPLSNRHAGDGYTCFADVHKAELHKVNFAEVSGTDAVLAAVEARRAGYGAPEAGLAESLETALTTDGEPAQISDLRARPASGTVRAGKIASESALPPGASRPEGPLSDLPQVPPAGEAAADAMALRLAALGDNDLGFLDLEDGDTVPSQQLRVRVKGSLGARFTLQVNGREIPENRVGLRAGMAANQTQVWEYVGVELAPGDNVIEVAQWDGFGNERGRCRIGVTAPGGAARLILSLPEGTPVADGTTPVALKVALTDERGTPVTARMPLTLETETGRFDVTDLDPNEPGTQVFLEGGKAEYPLIPPSEPGEGQVRVSTGTIEAEKSISFRPYLRPLLAVGIVEGRMNLRNMKLGAIEPAAVEDPFEKQIEALVEAESGSSSRVQGRTVLFLKGKIKGDCLLTASYDSDKAEGERLFRDIQPDEFYPVYGDASVRGFDAQSTGRLYVRIDKNRSYLLYGDYTTESLTPARELSTYSRSLTGIRHHFDHPRVRTNVFASQQSSRQVIEEIRANGTSGPYYLHTAPIVENSERVEVLVRDREQPGVILKRETRQRFTDYTVEWFTGRVLFKGPVPSVDRDLNTIAILVTYEVEGHGPQYWLTGAEVQMALTDRIEVGGAWVQDEDPVENAELRSINTTVRLGAHSHLIAEVAQTEKDSVGSGVGKRIALVHRTPRSEVHAQAGETDSLFDNPLSSLTGGRREARARGAFRVNDRLSLVGEGLWTQDVLTEGKRQGVQGYLEQSLPHNLRLETGLRWAEATSTPASPTQLAGPDVDLLSARLKLGYQPQWRPELDIHGEYEQDVYDPRANALALGADYQVADKTKLYARHELLSTLEGRYALSDSATRNTTVLGIDSRYMQDGVLFSETRARQGVNGREAEAALGLRNLWTVGQGLRLNTTFERVHPIAGREDSESTAVTGAVDYKPSALWRGTARLELRRATEVDSLLNTLGVAYKLNDSWTLLGKTILSLAQHQGPAGGSDMEGRLLFGMAYRDVATDLLSGLFKYEIKHEDDQTSDDGSQRGVHVFSTTANLQPRWPGWRAPTDRPWTLTGRYACKLTQQTDFGDTDRYFLQLVGGRVTLDLTKRFDVGVMAAVLGDGTLSGRQYGLGAEVGCLLSKDTWLGVGYNVLGLEDRDLNGIDYTAGGFYVRFRMKFDEDLLKRLHLF